MAAHRDRLSALPDATLTRVLSHLATDEAVRTSALSRRWHRVYATVPVVNLVDSKKGDENVQYQKVCFDQQVTGALLCRDPETPIGTFRLNVFNPTLALLDQWIITALSSGAEEIDVMVRYWHASRRKLCPFGTSERSSADFNGHDTYFSTPHHLFSSSTLRHLRLTNWTLDLPQDVPLGSLERLFLKRIMASDGALQQLISSCPRLTDLTLEECPSARKISVTSAHLRSFAMVCCHHARRVVLDTPCLRSLHYKGGLPGKSFIALANYTRVVAVAIDICEDLHSRKATELAPVTNLISRCTNLTYLHLSLRPAMAYFSRLFTSVVRCLPRLRQLELQGCLTTKHAIRSVAVLLQNTRNLEVLSLFPLCPEPPNKIDCFSDVESDSEPGNDDDEGVDYRCKIFVPRSLWMTPIMCLNHRVRRINLVKYKGRPLERMLAKFLLSKAAALEEFSVTLAAGRSGHKDEMTRELRSWRSNQRTRVTCA